MALFFLLLLLNQNQTHIPAAPPPPPPRTGQFKPGIAVIVGILTTIFSVTFLLLLYMKHCRREAYVNHSRGYYPTTAAATATLGRHSGVDRKVIESLPMFRFSSLTGQKDGLECAVCLNRFEPDEVLRLLPKCRHAFHVECVDTWLDAHSTCPLCRYRVDPEDVLLVVDARNPYNNSGGGGGGDRATPRNSNQGRRKENPRISGRHSSAGERGSSLEMIVENPGPDFRGRISLDSWHSRRKSGNHPKSQIQENQEGRNNKNEPGKDRQVAENPGRRSKASRKDGQLLAQRDSHRLEHRIVISAAVDLEAAEEGPRRWSDAQATEILYLRAEKIMGSGRGVNNERSVSEITAVSRYVSNNGGGKQVQEERAVRRWLDWISQSQLQSQTAGQSATSAAAATSIVG